MNQEKRQTVVCPRCFYTMRTEMTKKRDAPDIIEEAHEDPLDCARMLAQFMPQLEREIEQKMALHRKLQGAMQEVQRACILRHPHLAQQLPPGTKLSEGGLVIPSGG